MMDIDRIIGNSRLICGDSLEVLKTFPSKCIQSVITSPPYFGLRDYGVEEQLGRESTYLEYIDKLCTIFDEVKRVLKDNGTIWINIGDCYGGTGDKGKHLDPKFSKGRTGQSVSLTKNMDKKCLLQIPSRFSIEMCNRGWILRNEIIWFRPNQMPSSATDRFTVDFEKIFFFSKKESYLFNQQFEEYTAPMNRWGGVVLEARGKSSWDMGTGQKSYRERSMRPNPNGRNKRSVWEINTTPSPIGHYAMFPEKLIVTPVKASTNCGETILDPFVGAGTTCIVCEKLGRKSIGIDINPSYIEDASDRIKKEIEQTNLF